MRALYLLLGLLASMVIAATAQVTTSPSITGVPAPQSAVAITGGTISGVTISSSTYNGNTLTTGSSTYTGTAAQTYTFPTTSATIARTDAANSFAGLQTFGAGITNTGNVTTTVEFRRAGTPGAAGYMLNQLNAGSNGNGWYWNGTDTVNGVINAAIMTSMTASGWAVAGHLISGGSVPTVANNDCGSSTQGVVTAGGNDNSFLITVGTAAVTSCAVSFNATWTAAPKSCVIAPANATAAATGTTLAYVSAITTTKVTITGTALASAAYYVHCL